VIFTSWIADAAGLLAGYLLPLLGLGLTACILGRTLTRRFSFTGRLERGTVATALGLALAAHLLLLLGLAGRLEPLPLLVLAAGVHAVGIPAWRELLADLRAASRLPRWVWPVAAVVLAPLAVLTLYPPTGFDATMYHLPFARAFAETGGVPFLADRRFPVFPQANEVLFAAVMLFGRDVAANGVELIATLLTAALLVVWGREVFPTYRPAGWLAAAAFLGGPVVVGLGTAAYIEAGLTLFVTASLYSLDRWRRTGGTEWLVLAALFGATAADVKYLALFFLGIAGLAVVLAGGRERSVVGRLRDGLLFAAVGLAFLAPWYLRIYLHTGNPIFPYMAEVFGENPWQSLSRPETVEPLRGRLLRWLRLPWDVTFARQLYNHQPPFSPVYLAALPLLVFGAVRDSRVRALLATTGLYAFVFTWLPSDSRYLVPVLPLLSLALAGSLAEVHRRWPIPGGRRFAAALVLACVLPGWLYAGYRIARQGPLPVTPPGREAYLVRRLPLYPAVAWLNRRHGNDYVLWALHAENLAYFADGRLLGDWTGRASFARVLAAATDAESLHRELSRLGTSHLLVPVRPGKDSLRLPPAADRDLPRWFRLVYEDTNARIYEL
jgi:4-amino-4-deoxy-L-arabinose transferase-like glycosyltransferase